MLSRRALSLALAVVGLVGVSPAASAAVSQPVALAAIQQVDPAYTSISELAQSPTGMRAAAVAVASGGVRDVFLVGNSGPAQLLSDIKASGRACDNCIGDPIWAPNEQSLAVPFSQPKGESKAFTLVMYSTIGTPTAKVTVTDGTGGSFTADGRYFLAAQADITSLASIYAGESAVDLASWKVWFGYKQTGAASITYSAECTRMRESGWYSDDDERSRLEAALAGPDPRCVFPSDGDGTPGLTPTPTAAPTPTPTARPVATPTPAPTPRPIATPTPTPAAAKGIAIVSYVRSIKRARTSGIRLKVSTPGVARLRLYLIDAKGKTIARISKAAKGGPLVVVVPPTGAAKKQLKKVKSARAKILVYATTAAGVTTQAEQTLTLK